MASPFQCQHRDSYARGNAKHSREAQARLERIEGQIVSRADLAKLYDLTLPEVGTAIHLARKQKNGLTWASWIHQVNHIHRKPDAR